MACGFDVLGLALEQPGDQVLARKGASAGVTLAAVHGDDGRIPRDEKLNSATIAGQALLDHARAGGLLAGDAPGVALELTKGLPLASGLGGSAASAVAAVVAIDALFGLSLPADVLLQCALQGELTLTGGTHPDNVAPCLYGGVVLVREVSPLDVVRLPVPVGLAVALLHPHMEIETGVSRQSLPAEIPLGTATQQWANTAALVAALYSGDLDLLGRALVDGVAEPVRKAQIPGFDRVKDAALRSGALGCSLSGSGPSIFALCRSLGDAERVSEHMQEAFREAAQISSDVIVSPVAAEGARLMDPSQPAS